MTNNFLGPINRVAMVITVVVRACSSMLKKLISSSKALISKYSTGTLLRNEKARDIYPLGYVKTREHAKIAKMKIDPATAPIIREIFRRFANGESSYEVADWLNKSV